MSLVLLAVLWPADAHPQAVSTTLFRLFLKDGRVLTAYGEWARVDGRVVFSMPTRRGDPAAELHLITIPDDTVDWDRTERYATALRAERYATTRGEADFAQLSDEVARTLNEVATLPDPDQRLARAEAARTALAAWPGTHYGYKAPEVREILGVLDEVIADLRTSTGQGPINLALVAPPAVLPDEPLLPEPSEAETIEQLRTAAELAETPAARTSILQSLLGLLERAASLLPDAWSSLVRRDAEAAIAEERRLDAAYASLRTRTLAAGVKSVSKGDVRALERLRDEVHASDGELGRKRPAEVAGLLSLLDSQLGAARRYQLAHDQWELREPGMRRYERAVSGPLRAITRNRAALEDVRSQAGPPASRLQAIIDRWRRDGDRLTRVTPPSDLASVHALFRSAWEMADQAFALRLTAASTNDPARAQQASSAAAGALLLLGRARADLDAALEPPAPPPAP
ncbi:MAG: hypothetical protein R2712_23860 [Vicinamibacterales bacterium]